MKVVISGIEYPATLSTAEVAGLWNCSADLLQREVGTGRLPVEPLRLGHRYRWPTILVAEAIGLTAALAEEVGPRPLAG